MWPPETRLWSVLPIVVGLILGSEATIRVISTDYEETVYIVQERPILTNIDSPSKGMLIMAQPSNACKPVVPAPPLPFNSSLSEAEGNSSLTSGPLGEIDFAWVLLVSWKSMDECTLAMKADHALKGGYSVILFEDPSPLVDLEPEALSPLLTPVVSSPAYEYGWTDASVYAFTVEPEDWKILKNNFTSDAFYLTFEESSSMSNWFTYFLLGILIIGAVFFTVGLSYVLVQLLVLILIWIRESIVTRIQQVRRDRRRRLPPSQLKKIPIQQWNSDMLQDICSICLESFVVSERVRILPCSHVFHQVCIDPWLLKQRRKCPNCKRKIVFPEENRDSDSSSDDERTPLIRSSSARESTSSSSPQHSRYPQGNSTDQENDVEYIEQDDNVAEMIRASNRIPTGREQSDCQDCPHVEVTVPDATATGTDDQVEIKDRVEQLCARMENVGRKIEKKVKANQASKMERDLSPDTTPTGIQSLLVSVSVEPCNESNESTCAEDDQSDTTESHNVDQTSDHNCSDERFKCQGAPPCPSSPELEIKVVPATFPASVNSDPGGSGDINHRQDGNILSDLNA